MASICTRSTPSQAYHWICETSFKLIGSKTTDECGDDWRRVHTTRDEYIRVGIVQEMSTYECLEVRRQVHTTGDEYIRVHTNPNKLGIELIKQ